MMASSDMAEIEWGDVDLPADRPDAGAADLAFSLRSTIRRRRRTNRRTQGGRYHAPRVLITRPEPHASSLAGALAAAGAESVMASMLRVALVRSEAAHVAWANIGEGVYDWVVFPSGNAVDGFFGDTGRPSGGGLGRTRVAAVGARTAERLRRHGITVDLVPARGDAAALVAALDAVGVRGATVLLAQGNLARSELADGLRAAGATVTTVTTYHVDVTEALDPDVSVLLYQGDIDAVTFASPSAATTLAGLLVADPSVMPEVPAVCIGETTAAATRDAGWTVAAVASQPSDAGLVDAVRGVLSQAGALPVPVLTKGDHDQPD